MALVSIVTPYSATELVQDINNNFTELEMNKAESSDLANYVPNLQKGAANGVATLDAAQKVNETAKTAEDYAATGTISTKFGQHDTSLAGISAWQASVENGNTTVGAAKVLDPDPTPEPSQYYGTSPAGTLGFHNLPVPEGGSDYTGPRAETFTDSDARWGAAVGGIYTLTIPHGGSYPLVVFRQDGAVHSMVFVDMQRNATNALIRSNEKFTGYVVMG